jgi:hypothetical protein
MSAMIEDMNCWQTQQRYMTVMSTRLHHTYAVPSACPHGSSM